LPQQEVTSLKPKGIPDPQKFAEWSDRVEKLIRKGLWLLIVLLLLFQSALQVPVIRNWLSPTDRLEGISYVKGSGR
jgi:hypothetical protein